MSQQRYHIHVCLVKNEQPDLENALQVAMADNYFLTWDLIGSPANFMDYTRKQIDRCDYVLFILGDNYGNLSPSGVSFLHLSYVYATTKRKTLFTLIKQAETVSTHDEVRTRQRSDFASMLEKDQAEYTTLYAHNLEMAVKDCLFNLSHLIKVMPKLAWIKSAKPQFEPKERLFTPNKDLVSTRSPQFKDFDSENFAKDALSKNTSLSSQSKTINSQQTPNKKKSNVSPQAQILITADNNPNIGSNMTHASVDDSLSLEDNVILHYTAHAYKDGNLMDLKLQQSLMWLDILVSLRKLKEPFTGDMMQRNLNTLLNGYALSSAKKIQPQTHAVARTQINANDFEQVKKQLIAQHWLTQAKSATGVASDWWQLSDDLK